MIIYYRRSRPGTSAEAPRVPTGMDQYEESQVRARREKRTGKIIGRPVDEGSKRQNRSDAPAAHQGQGGEGGTNGIAGTPSRAGLDHIFPGAAETADLKPKEGRGATRLMRAAGSCKAFAVDSPSVDHYSESGIFLGGQALQLSHSPWPEQDRTAVPDSSPQVPTRRFSPQRWGPSESRTPKPAPS
jgi:hypothetical protein